MTSSRRAMSRAPVFGPTVIFLSFCLISTCSGGESLRSEAIESDIWVRRNLVNSELNNVWYFGRSFVSDVLSEDGDRGVLKIVQNEDPSSGVDGGGVTSEARTGGVTNSERGDFASGHASDSVVTGAVSGGSGGDGVVSQSGDSSGSVLGSQSGSSSESLSDSQSGDSSGGVSGPQSGSSSESVSDPQSGDLNGGVSGLQSGNSSESVLDPQSVDSSGGVSGTQSGSSIESNLDPQSGDSSGGVSGPQSGSSSESVSDPQSGDSSGGVSGPQSRSSSESVLDPQSGDSSGGVSGPQSGSSSESVSDPQSGDSSGGVSGPQSGSSSESVSDPQSGDSSGGVSGPQSGSSSESVSDPQSGDSSGVVLGPQSRSSSESVSDPQCGGSSNGVLGPQSGVSRRILPERIDDTIIGNETRVKNEDSLIEKENPSSGVSGLQTGHSSKIPSECIDDIIIDMETSEDLVIKSENQSEVSLTADQSKRRNTTADGESNHVTSSGDSMQAMDPPLILTELIEAGRLTEGREKSRVSGGPFPNNIPSYSGFLTVDKKYNSNLFFWFFPSEKNYSRAPVILWLNGGPGDSSLMGLFIELGPFSVAPDVATLILNKYSWHRNHSIVFIDNPVGTGFSFTNNEEGYATNQTQIGSSLYQALLQFFTLFHELQSHDFYIAGSSYAGKYVPTLGHFIHTRNPEAQLKINLKGIAVCSGYTDPINMMGLNEFAYQLGFIDSQVRDEMKSLEEETKRAALSGDMMGAFDKKVETLRLFCRYTTFVYAYNLMHPKEPYEEYRFSWFLRRREVRAHLHVGDVEFTTDEESTTKVFEFLMEDIMVSAGPWLEELLQNQYRVLYYNGQLDITVTYPMSARVYDQLKWRGAEEYKRGERIPWYVDGVLAGYMKSGGNFTDVVVRNAGHLVAHDQPVWALDLITRFIANTLPTSDVEF